MFDRLRSVLVDVLDLALRGAHARGALFNLTVVDPPWCMRIEDGAALALFSVLNAPAWVWFDDTAPAALAPGEIVITRGPTPYTVGSAPGLRPQLVVHPGGRATAPDGTELPKVDGTNRRVCDLTAPDAGSHAVVSGTYDLHGEIGRRLTNVLPNLVTVPGQDLTPNILDLIVSEISKQQPGQQMMLERLLDMVLISALRTWFTNDGSDTPAWYRAAYDEMIGRALQVLHDEPQRPWSVHELAREVGASRAAFAKRFAELVGEPPMTYLTNWRITLGADRLVASSESLEAIAAKVGYSSAFAFSAAFRRRYGVSPGAYRKRSTRSALEA